MLRWLPCLGLLACVTSGSIDVPAGDPGTDTASPDDSVDTADSDPLPASMCTSAGGVLSCPYQTVTLWTGASELVPRDVHYGLPAGTPPQDGWPVVILFQGSYLVAELFWESGDGPFGVLEQVRTVQRLLDSGFAVITPEAHLDGRLFWDTNVWPYSLAWETSPDHQLMLELFRALEDGTFGPVDRLRLAAGGISSGGYMTSRMAVAYPGRFGALAVHSASYATCLGTACVVPDLPPAHPPTLFVHGAHDPIVPLYTARAYRDALDDQGTSTGWAVDPDAGHEWTALAISEIPAWFALHL